ncbi:MULTISPECIES: magnesium-translocating P-type ATPase [Yersinia pseudotuberculosis complex]|uniref:Magnesium-transporting ATPase, P-type 1 n=1 Tax=Yersinia pseudotuberculosis serotype O:1b (strain IP 31758) TaxID=349747 RepID=A0A0U1QUB0_YERP3|nr:MULTISPECIES: magnesium-translocating P-type ATPase [Yersinia pseudotuberculosis complex]ABS46008.1 magnesium-translocating P-type ATPase [Yersinia pseudotuberculosis IP 31758]MCE4111304.1 magnesium-translocating P-type ATPase [Yersinia pseudotuberculosis]MCF1162467.1 magnesium-translocating P-type ATPase [Yersinia pseudotuberculosis]UFA61294.1 Mg(2+) transport ATPase [Yersinia pseudotuberculosis]WLF05379.1 magnesium-translocating P-type ATPase [Yersinia pseudotuberculosis]
MRKLEKTDASRSNNKKPFAIALEAKNSLEQTLFKLNTHLNGLTEEDARERLELYGVNQVAHEKAPPAFLQLLAAFNNPFIFVLIILAAISFFTDYWLPLQEGGETDLIGVSIIVTMVLISGLLRFWQEYRTNKAAEALKSMVRTTATVLRRGHYGAKPTKQEIPINQLVPGDIILLSAGDMIPADLRLINSRDLFVSQAILTGEAIPVEKYDAMGCVSPKSVDAGAGSEGELLELSNICLMGTNVASGTAMGVVVATGGHTYFGSLAKSIVGTRAQTAFDRGVNSVSWLLIRFMLVMVPIVLLINGFTKGDWTEAALFALAVAVGLTPEMLPMIVSSNLAKGAIAMARRKVVVKRLNAIQNFGAMDVLCTDKTGTLTQDRIILEHHLDVSGCNDNKVLQLAWLNSFHQSGMRNLMDQAVIKFSRGKPEIEALRNFNKVDELPFDFIRRRLSIVVKDAQQQQHLICKGAVEEMLSICTHVREGDDIFPLDAARRATLQALATQYNEDGFRVLLLATRELGAQVSPVPLNIDDERDLVVQGLLTFLDPPKESAAAAIAALRENGVAVKVLTGDNPIITAKICRDVGLEPGEPLNGRDIEAMNDATLAREVELRTVFTKLTPLQKSRVLKMLQSNGHTVGFLGDGINDAPALRDADVGISVDTGTDIAKESADIILLEKDLMVLEAGVIKGRETFGNIIKYLNMTASSNFGNVFSVLVASAFIPFLPMLAIHLLLQNLMYDISQLSLPWDKMDKEFLRKPRKWDAKNIGRFMLWVGPTSSIFDITTYALMWFVFAANSIEHQALFQSGWFIEGLLSQTLVVHMLRTQKIPFIQSTAALPVLLTTGLIMAIGIYIPFSPLGTLVGLEPLPWQYFPWLAGTLICYCVVAQLMKRCYIRRFGEWL